MLNVISGLLSPDATTTNSYESIATVSVGSGGAASISFTSIASNWKHLQIRMLSRTANSGTDDNILIKFNSDAGSNYAWHYLQGDGGSVAAGGAASQGYILSGKTVGNTVAANIFGAGVVDILDYANTSKYKTTRTLTGYDINGGGKDFFASGLWQSTSAITSIDLYSVNGNMLQYSSFALYGIKG